MATKTTPTTAELDRHDEGVRRLKELYVRCYRARMKTTPGTDSYALADANLRQVQDLAEKHLTTKQIVDLTTEAMGLTKPPVDPTRLRGRWR